jgi:hypothetical protein
MVPTVYSLCRRPLAVGGKAGGCGFAAEEIFVGGLPTVRRRRLAVTPMLHFSLRLASFRFGLEGLIFILGFCILPTFDSAGVVALGPCKQGFALVAGL